jgi:hypothetical protein
MLVTLPKNVDEKKCWQTSDKMLETLPKNVDEQMLVTLPKMLMRKNVGNTFKKC